jgi:hypothetical protein
MIDMVEWCLITETLWNFILSHWGVLRSDFGWKNGICLPLSLNSAIVESLASGASHWGRLLVSCLFSGSILGLAQAPPQPTSLPE